MGSADNHRAVGLGVGLGVGLPVLLAVLATVLGLLLVRRRKKRKSEALPIVAEVRTARHTDDSTSQNCSAVAGFIMPDASSILTEIPSITRESCPGEALSHGLQRFFVRPGPTLSGQDLNSVRALNRWLWLCLAQKSSLQQVAAQDAVIGVSPRSSGAAGQSPRGSVVLPPHEEAGLLSPLASSQVRLLSRVSTRIISTIC